MSLSVDPCRLHIAECGHEGDIVDGLGASQIARGEQEARMGNGVSHCVSSPAAAVAVE